MLWFKCPLTQWLEGTWRQEIQSRSKQALADLCGLFVERRTWRGSRSKGGGRRVSPPRKSDRKSLIFPWHTQPPRTHPFRVRRLARGNMHTISRANTLLKPGAPPPTSAQQPPPLPQSLPGRLSLSLSPRSPSHLCLCGAAAAQRTEGAAFTSEHISHQMSPFAASPSNIQADNAPCILNIWLTTSPTKGAGWRSGLHGWWNSKPHRQWHLELVHTTL